MDVPPALGICTNIHPICGKKFKLHLSKLYVLPFLDMNGCAGLSASDIGLVLHSGSQEELVESS